MANPSLVELKKDVNQSAGKTRSKKTTHDFIVIGLGSMGSSTCYYLAKQGFTVLGIEQHEITHENGSHSGQSRLIRQAYFEHPDYVPLLRQAYEGWLDLEQISESQLFYDTGILYSGKANDFLIKGSLRSASQYDIDVQELNNDEVKRQYSQFNLPPDYTTILEPNAGFVTPERAILTYVQQAISSGAEIHRNETVESVTDKEGGVTVKTSQNTYRARKLIVTAGAWTARLLPFLKPKLKVTRQVISWVNTTNDKNYRLGDLPCWGINQEGSAGLYYGFPILDHCQFGGPPGLKIGYHFPGEETDPDNQAEKNVDEDKEIIANFMSKFLPGCFKSFSEIKSCLYTYSPDDHFIIDHHPDLHNVIFAAGFSGHGFKFAPVIGMALADLASEGSTKLPIKFLSLDRFE